MRGKRSALGPSAVQTALTLAVWIGTGCASRQGELEQEIHKLQETVMVLENQNDRLEERVAGLEAAQRTPTNDDEAPAQAAERPNLKVIKVGPGEKDPAGPEPSKPPDAEAPPGTEPARPLIHGTGDELKTSIPEPPTSWCTPAPTLDQNTGTVETERSA